MKKFLSVAMMFLVASGAACAQARAEDDGDGDGGRKGARRHRAERARARFEELVKELGLTEDQQEPVRQKLKAHLDDLANYHREHGEQVKALRKRMKEARRSGDEEAIKEIAAKLKKHREAVRRMRSNLQAQLADVLTEEQMKKFKALWARRGRRRGPGAGLFLALRALDLTAEQRKAVRKIMSEAKAEAKKAESGQEKRRIMAAAVEKVRSDVLTDAQRKKLADLRAREARRWRAWGWLMGLDLTKEQREKIRAIRAEYRKKLRAAETRQARRAIFREMREKIRGVLTEEQRKKLKKRLGRIRKRREGRRPKGHGDAQGGETD